MTKIHEKMQISNANLCLMKLSASLVIYYNSSINTEVEKQNKT